MKLVADEYVGEKDEETDTRHLIPANPRDEACFNQIRSWFSNCLKHKNCGTSFLAPLPRFIIEVPSKSDLPAKLTLSEGKLGRYLILSHCNGGFDLSSLGDIKLGNLNPSSLPKTFQDAIEITRRMGFEHLWIAGLCGGQNDPATRAEESAKFPSIYGQCAMMISATAGSDLNAGILNNRLVLQSPALGKNKDRYLRQRFLRWPWALETSPLAQRGWALQERILAPRIVHYTDRQIIYECADGLKFEASGILDKQYGSGQIRQQYRKSCVQPFIEDYVKTASSNPHPVPQVKPELLTYTRRLEAWHSSVNEFSKRTLGNPSHKLSAVAAVAKILDNGELGEYLAGIWSKNIGIGLAWSRVYGVLTPAAEYRAPSFSWAGVDGAVSSLVLNWPADILEQQKREPEWIERYGPKLLSTQMIPMDASNPYQGAKEGSNITISASVISLSALLEAIKPKNEEESRLFCGNLVLDQSWILDCPCCGPKHPSEEERKSEYKRFENGLEHHLCIILQSDGWKNGESVVDLLVVRREEVESKKDEEKEVRYVRVGLMRLSLDFHYKPVWENEDRSFNAKPVHEVFDGMGWKRRELKLF